jgi:hypothetical protein
MPMAALDGDGCNQRQAVGSTPQRLQQIGQDSAAGPGSPVTARLAQSVYL